MACGDKYAHLLVTAQGQRPEDASETALGALVGGEYSDWLAVARRIAELVSARWNALRRAASGQAAAVALQARITAYFGELDRLPSSAWAAPLTPDDELVGAAISNGREGLCVLELVEDALAKAGLPAQPVPGATKPRPNWREGLGKAAAVLAAIVGLAYFAGKDD